MDNVLNLQNDSDALCCLPLFVNMLPKIYNAKARTRQLIFLTNFPQI